MNSWLKEKKKIVNITDEDTKSKKNYGRDKSGRIIKLEDKGDTKERAKKNRIFQVLKVHK